MENDLLTAAQAAEAIGATPEWIYSLIRRKRLSAERFGRAWMIRRKDLLALEPGQPGRPPASQPVEPKSAAKRPRKSRP